MKIKKSELKQMILQEMHAMRKAHGHHDELMDVVMQASGGCPIRARSLLQGMMNRIAPMAHEREMQLHRDVPNPATSGVIPHGEELMGDEAYMEQKKTTAVRGPGHSLGILGPGFR